MKKLLLIFILQLFISSQSFADAKTDLSKNIKDYEKKILSNQSNSFVSSDEPEEKMRVLGWYNFSGEAGNKKNYQRSIMWFEMASQYAHPAGAYHLGLFHYAGIAGLEQNLDKAHNYFVLAYEHWKKGDFRFGMSLEDFSNEMNQFNPNPSKEFANLRDLFIKAIDIPSNNRYLNLKNLTNTVQMKTVDDFLNSEKKEALCAGDGDERKLKIYISWQNEFILRSIMPILEDSLTNEEFILSYSYARKISEKIEWFEYEENEVLGDRLYYSKFYFNKKTKRLNLNVQPYDIAENAKIYIETYNKYQILKKEKLLEVGEEKHIDLEIELNEYFYKNLNQLKKSTSHEGEVMNWNMICEL
jgi:hypothetical protein